jgi:hypothetical protein
MEKEKLKLILEKALKKNLASVIGKIPYEKWNDILHLLDESIEIISEIKNLS